MPTRWTFIALAIGLAALMPGPSSGATAPDARIAAVRANGSAGSYTFVVTIASNDTGCDHYANWWEVVDEKGSLVYHRVLLHDHADEQPFTRDGGPVAVSADATVTVRVHMNTSGYSVAGMRGSVASGFKPIDLPDDYARALAKQQPLPEGC
jgi:hypothetical protein